MSRGSTKPVNVSGPASRLATLPVWPLDEDPPRTLGWGVARWAEELLVQPNGPRAGEPFRLTVDQLRFLLWWYSVDENGEWLFSHGARRLAKGSGKSPFAAVLALAEFCGPVRLDTFDDREPGGCRGRHVDLPWVQIVATAESQTKNTMRMVRAFAPKGSRIAEEYQLDVGKQIYYRLPEGTLEVITSSVTATEGAEASFVVADETEHWKPSNSGPELASTLEDNLAKSGSRMLETSNAWEPGIDCVAERTWDAWLAQEEGRTKGETRILYDARIAPPDTDMSDPDSLREALEWVYGDCDWKRDEHGILNIRPIMEKIWSPRSKPSESRRKYLNQPTAAEDAWVSLEEWNRLEDKTITVASDEPVVLFFDGSKSRDGTALIGCRVDDGHIFTLGVWEPDPNNPNDTVDATDVDRVVELAFQNHRVVAFFADVREWESFALTEWPRRYGKQLRLWAVPSGRPPQAIAWDMRGHGYEFAKATEAVEAEILEQQFTHDGHSAVARHVANARRRPYRDAVGIGKESKDSPRKIDAAVCVIGARMVRRLAVGAGIGKTGKAKVVVFS